MDKKQDTKYRPPIVTIMGHVDHGKTTLLDKIRKTNVVAREHGGITQHIGAYQITFHGKPITFIDTPGHAAFEKMRSRGAEVADVVILVVAATEGVKPQTREAIKHIKNAQNPVIIAITKTDLSDINIEKVKQELQKEGIIVEQYGGDAPAVEVAAPKGKGIPELLEVIQLLWEINPQPSLTNDPLQAVVVESFLDKNRGPVTTVIVKKGTLKVAQKISVDSEKINVKALIDDAGENVSEATPGKPVEVLGFKKVLEVGSIVAEGIITEKETGTKEVTLSEIIAKSEDAKGRFKVIIKADVNGSLEAIQANLPENILVVTSGVGEVTPSDISFAKAAQAPIIAFNLRLSNQVKIQAEREGVVIRDYDVIYNLISDMEEVASSFEQEKYEQKITGRAKIIATFDIEGKKIAGAQVIIGKLKLGDQIVSKSADTLAGGAKIASLKRFKKDVEVVSQGQECGIGFDPKLDFAVGDIIESLGSN